MESVVSTIESTGHMTSTWSLDGYWPMTTDTYYQQISAPLQHAQNVVSYISLLVNVVKIAAFAQKSMRNSPSGTFMLTISLSHFIWILLGVINSIVELVITEPEKKYAYSLFYLYVYNTVSIVIYRAGLFIVCLMSSERLYAVSRPLHIKQFILARRPLLFIAIIFLLTACYHIYVPLQNTVQTKPRMNGSRIVVYGYTDWYFRNRDIVDGFSAAGKIIFVFVPLVWLSAFNVLVVRFLRNYSDDRKAIKSTADEEASSRRDRQMTLTILACTAGYVIFILPVAIHVMAMAVVPEYNFSGRFAKLVLLMTQVQDICLQVSYMTDFLSFLLLSNAFRDCLMRFLMRNKLSKEFRKIRVRADITPLSP